MLISANPQADLGGTQLPGSRDGKRNTVGPGALSGGSAWVNLSHWRFGKPSFLKLYRSCWYLPVLASEPANLQQVLE